MPCQGIDIMLKTAVCCKNEQGTDEKSQMAEHKDWPKEFKNILLASDEDAALAVQSICAQLDANPELAQAHDNDGWTMLHFSASMPSACGAELARHVLTKQPDTEARTALGRTALHQTADYDNPDVAKLILKANPALANAQDKAENTPLHLAIHVRSYETLRVLLSFNPDTSIKNEKGKTPLELALVKNCSDALRILLHSNKLDQASQSAVKSGFLLQKHIADSSETSASLEAVQLLLKAGADITFKNEHGQTALHLAIREEKTAIARLLLKKGADIGATDAFYKSTPLHYAAGNYNTAPLRLLLAHGADINAQNGDGETPLHTALQDGNKEIVRTLLTLGADPSIRNKEGKTPADILAEDREMDMLAFLNKLCAARERRDEKARIARKESAKTAHALRLQALEGMSRKRNPSSPPGN